jgi:hypothetical protein
MHGAKAIVVNSFSLLSGSGVVSASRHQGGDEFAEEGSASIPGVMHELEEAEEKRQLFLRDAAVRPQPGARSARASCVASRPALPARASASSWLTRSTVSKKRTRASRSRTQFAPIAIARCVLPEPVPPTRTALRLPARKSPRCRSRTSAAFTGEAAKSNSPSAFATGNLAWPIR